MMQHDRAPSENVCGSLSTDYSAASMHAPPEIIDRRQHAATGFQGDAPGQWDWRSVISPLPTSTMDNVAIATDTRWECVAGSQNVIVLEHTDEDPPGGQQCEGIDKKTQHRHTHRKHKDRNKHNKHTIKAKPPTEKETNEYSTISQHVGPVVITEQTTRDQSLTDRSMSSPQPLTESWMCEQRTEGDPRTQQETAIYAIPRSGEDRSMSSSQPLTESWMCEQRTEGDPRTQQETAIYAIPRSGEDRSMSSSQPLTESWMCEQRTEGDPRTQQDTAIYAIPRSGEDRSMSSSQPLTESWMCEQRTEGVPRTQQETAIYAIPRSGEDRSMSSSQPLTESWMCEQPTEGDPRTQQETAIYAIPRSGEDRSMSSSQPLTESWMCEQRTEGDHRTQQETAIYAIPRSGEDRSMSSSQPLTESWMCEQRTEGDPRTQQETAIYAIPRSGDDHAKKHKHGKHHGGHHQKRDVAEGRSGYVSNVTEDGGMDRRHFVENTETTGRVVDESLQQVVFGDDHSKEHKHSKHHGRQHRRDIAEGRSDHPTNAATDKGMERKHKDIKTNARVIDGPVQHFTVPAALSTPRSCPSYLRRLGLDKRARSGSSSYVPTIHAVPLPPSRLDHQYDATSNNVASVSRQMVARANWGNTYETIPQGEQQRKSFCVYPA